MKNGAIILEKVAELHKAIESIEGIDEIAQKIKDGANKSKELTPEEVTAFLNLASALCKLDEAKDVLGAALIDMAVTIKKGAV